MKKNIEQNVRKTQFDTFIPSSYAHLKKGLLNDYELLFRKPMKLIRPHEMHNKGKS